MKNNTPIGPNTQMRDAVINRLYDLSEQDKDIMFITADMGAGALDRWRKNRPAQYRDVGIAEQGMSSIAAGMAKEGKRVFIYAIAPFVTTRIYESHKLNAGVQKIPYTTIGMGSGFSYGDSGPTHYTTEDISIMRAVPNMEILSPSDSVMAADMAEYACYSCKPIYLRLERKVLPILNKENGSLKEGFKELVQGDNTCLISSSATVHKALEVQIELKNREVNIGVIDLYRIKPLNEHGLENVLRHYKKVVSMEEHLLAGGIGSILAELKSDRDLPFKLKRIGINDRLVYYYGRNNIQRELGLDTDSIIKETYAFNLE